MKTPPRVRCAAWQAGFTLVELLVSMTVLVVIMVVVGQMFSGASKLITQRTKSADVDSQARTLLDRMAIDFASMVKRPDVNYFMKSDTAETPSSTAQTNGHGSKAPMAGNDQIAFYCTAPGYFRSGSASTQGTFSVVAYRVFIPTTQTTPALPTYQMQRFGRGLFWAGSASPSPNPSPTVSPSSDQFGFLPVLLSEQWSSATDATTTDANYEALGPPVFRFEYYYLLKSGALSTTPWDAAGGGTNLDGLQDVSAIGVTLAAIDAKSRNVVSDATLAGLAAQMVDFDAAKMPAAGILEASWRKVLQDPNVPPSAMANLHIYHRFFYLSAR